MNKISKILIILIFSFFIMLLSNQKFAETIIYNMGPTAIFDNAHFVCRDHNKTIGAYYSSSYGSSSYWCEYKGDTQSNNEILERSVGFAMWYASKYVQKYGFSTGREIDNTITYKGSTYDMAWQYNQYETNDPAKMQYPLLTALTAVQRAMWTSRYWGNTSNALDTDAKSYDKNDKLGKIDNFKASPNGWNLRDSIDSRTDTYGTFYYGLVEPIKNATKKDEAVLFKDITDTRNLEATFNEERTKCTVGPYKIAVNLNKNNKSTKKIGSQSITDIAIANLRTELTGGAGNYTYQGVSSQFAGIDKNNSGKIEIRGVNGTNVKLINGNGNEISFPEFGIVGQDTWESFYIEFDCEEDIESIGNPEFSIWYDDGYTATHFFAVATRFSTDGHTTMYWRSNKGQNDNSGAVGNKTTVNIRGTNYEFAGKLGNTPAANVAQKLMWVDLVGHSASEIEIGEEIILPDVELPPPPPKAAKLGGNVWIDIGKQKTDEKDGIKASEDKNFAGMQVTLIDAKTNKIVATTTTDANGNYMFYGKNSDDESIVSPDGEYKIIFNYNGQIWQPTYLSNELEATKSNAQESSNARSETNQFFSTINAYPNNYVDSGEKLIAYPLKEKMRDASGNYYINQENKSKVLTYEDVYNKFVEYAEYDETVPDWEEEGLDDETWNRSKSYATADKNLRNWLEKTQKLTANDVTNIMIYRQNTFVSSYVSEYSRGTISTRTLEITDLDDEERQNINFGVTERVTTDLNIINDVYKARIIVNGKETTYTYDKRAAKLEGNQNLWKLETRASDTLFNEQSKYNQGIESADYLYDGTQVVGSDGANRNLQVYVTYKVSILNQGSTFVKVNNLLNYMDNIDNLYKKAKY